MNTILSLQTTATSLLLSTLLLTSAAPDPTNVRKPKNDADLRYWLENMVWHHHFSTAEIHTATGLSPNEIERALKKFNIGPATRPQRAPTDPLLVVPYPGGRHPRIGFLDGAIRPNAKPRSACSPRGIPPATSCWIYPKRSGRTSA